MGVRKHGHCADAEPFSHAVNMLQQLTQLPHAPRILGQLNAFSSCGISLIEIPGQQVEQNINW